METLLISTLITQIRRQLNTLYNNLERANTHAWWLVMQVTHQSMAELLCTQEISLSAQQRIWLAQAIDQIAAHKPIQYILGSVPFAGLTIKLQAPLLIPRPETEAWVLALIDDYTSYRNLKLNILDIGTGTGCIALALAHAFTDAQVYAVDISTQALRIAAMNAQENQLDNITFLLSDLFSNIDPDLRFDLIVSNPPYISAEEWQTLQPEVKVWEDYQALVAADSGYAMLHQIIDQARLYLRPQQAIIEAQLPQLVIEFGYNQADTVHQLLIKHGYHAIKKTVDDAGHIRTLQAQYHTSTIV